MYALSMISDNDQLSMKNVREECSRIDYFGTEKLIKVVFSEIQPPYLL